MRRLFAPAVLLALAAPAMAQKAPVIFEVRSLHDGTTVHSPGVIAFHKGRIVAVGASGKVTLPKGATRLPLRRFHIRPGAIDGNAQRGADGDLSENVRLTPGFSAADAFDPFARGFDQALAAGVTHAVFAPDKGAVLAGKAVLLELSEPLRGIAARREVALFGSLAGSAFRGNPWPPASQSEAVRAIAGMLADTRASRLKPGAGYRSWRPDAAALRAVLKREMPLALRVDSTGSTRAALGLFSQFKLKGVLIGGRPAFEHALAAIKKSGAGVVLDPISTVMPERDLVLPARLAEAGIPFAFSSKSPDGLESDLWEQAALAAFHGLKVDAAWAALTRGPRQVYGLPTGGQLRVGDPATFLILARNPKSLPAPMAVIKSGVVPRALVQMAMMGGMRGGGRR